MHAAKYGNVKVMQLLLDHGACARRVDKVWQQCKLFAAYFTLFTHPQFYHVGLRNGTARSCCGE